MEKEKEQIELLEKERLLTQNERNHIVNTMENRDIKLGVVVYGIYCFLTVLMNMQLIAYGGIIIAIILFLIENIGVILLLRDSWNEASNLAELAKQNKVYVKEAIYITTGYANYARFKVDKNGRRIGFCAYALIKDDVKRGDKVILVQVDEKWKWIYKARADEASEDERKITLNS